MSRNLKVGVIRNLIVGVRCNHLPQRNRTGKDLSDLQHRNCTTTTTTCGDVESDLKT